MTAKYIGNIATRKLHITEFADKRCRIDNMKEENKVEFDTYDEAMKYPNEKRAPLFNRCAICFPKYDAERGTQK